MTLHIRKHPHSSDRIRAILARTPFWALVLGLFAALFMSSVIFTVVHWLNVDARPVSAAILAYDYFLFLLLTPRPNFPPQTTDDTVQIIYLVGASVRIIVPGIFIGALTYKLVSPTKIIVFRKHLSLYQRDGLWRISARIYNSSGLAASQVRPRVYLRQRVAGQPNQMCRFSAISRATPIRSWTGMFRSLL